MLLGAASGLYAYREYTNRRYLANSPAVLGPEGSLLDRHSAAFNSAHAVVGKRAEVEQQQRLIADNQQRVNAVQQTGGRLETVQQDVVVRSEEQMVWSKERFVTERVRLRKVVATEMVTLTVPVRRERIEIDRIPVDGPGVLVSEQETAQSEDEEQFELILCEERPRVVNDIVPVERVRMKKVATTGTQHLEMELRKEHIDYTFTPPDASQQPRLVSLQTIEGQKEDGLVDTTGGRVRVMTLLKGQAGAGVYRQ